MSLTLKPTRIDTGTADEEGCLVFAENRLVAVLVLLSDEHEDAAGKWFLEHGFGKLDEPHQPTFADLHSAQEWINKRRSQARQSG